MDFEWNFWETPWAFYFEGYIWLPLLTRLLLLSGPLLIGTRRHGRHLRWFWRRLLEFPRGKTIALNFILGMTVPLAVGLTIRFTIPPFGSGWEKWSYTMAALFLIFLGVHFVWDLRRVIKARHLAQKVIAADLDRYHGYYDKLRPWLKRLHTLTHPEERMEPGRGKSLVKLGRTVIQGLYPPLALVAKVVEIPQKASRRWMFAAILTGLFFYLSPLAALLILFF